MLPCTAGSADRGGPWSACKPRWQVLCPLSLASSSICSARLCKSCLAGWGLPQVKAERGAGAALPLDSSQGWGSLPGPCALVPLISRDSLPVASAREQPCLDSSQPRVTAPAAVCLLLCVTLTSGPLLPAPQGAGAWRAGCVLSLGRQLGTSSASLMCFCRSFL